MYPDQYEYPPDQINKLTLVLQDHFMGNVKVKWYKQNDYINYADKIDATVLIFTDMLEVENIQIKSSNYQYTFTIGKKAMVDYLTGRHNLDYLLVATFKYDLAYLFSWEHFIDVATEHLTKFEDKGDYFIIRLDWLTQFIQCEIIEIW